MNYISHHEVARRVNEDAASAYMFGSMLPDFASMYGFRVRAAAVSNPSLQAGVRLHHATDKVFDELPEVIELERSLRTSLYEFMPRWPGFQCANAGKDLMFDSLVINDDRAMASFRGTMLSAAGGDFSINGVTQEPPQWLPKIEEIGRREQFHYDQPGVIAEILFFRLKNRPTKFDPRLKEPLAETIALHMATVRQIGTDVMSKVVARQLSANSPSQHLIY